jgi:hypothetical protein
MIHDPDRL